MSDPAPGWEARKLLRAARVGTLASVADGQPFASLVTPACAPDLSLLLLLSDLSEHTRHLRAEPRCSVLVVGSQQGPNPQTTPPLGGEQGRCGFGPRLPLLLISPFAKRNAVDHNLSNQASMINFVEYNWGLPGIPGSVDQAQSSVDASEGVPFDLAGMFEFSGGKNGKLFLDPGTGEKQG